MDAVRTFLFDPDLLSESAPSVGVVGIAFPDGTVGRHAEALINLIVREKA